MAKPTFQVALRPQWKKSKDVLLKALAANGGELYSALESVDGQVGRSKRGPTTLNLRYTTITDEGMEAFADCTEVKNFTASKRITEASFLHLARMAKMERLGFEDIHISGDGLKHLAAMTELEQLQFFACTFSNASLQHLPALPGLRDLSLSSSKGCTDADLSCVLRLGNLTSLCLNGAPATGPGLRHLAALKHLVSLDLSERIATDDDLSHLPLLPRVESLSLRYSYVTDRGLACLSNFPAVTWVDLEMCDVSDAGLRHLAALPKLESVNLNHTKVTIRGVRELQAARPGISVSARDCAGEPKPKDVKAELIKRPEQREPAPVARSWARLEKWFAANLPEVLTSLNPPATKAQLAALEKRIGKPLPKDFRESYLIHNGQDPEGNCCLGLIFGNRLEPIDSDEGIIWLYEHRVQHEWPEKNNWMNDWVFFPPDAIREAWSGPGWVAFYWDIGRNFLGIDLEPGPNGVVGQVIPFGSDDEFRPVLAQSFAHFLEDIADELEAGNAVVEPPEVSNTLFGLKGGFDYKKWAEAKLPLAFQRAKAMPRFVPEDHATPVDEPLAAQAIEVLRNFLMEMNEYEKRWLAVRPIHEYGVSSLSEWQSGINGFSSSSTLQGEKPRNGVEEVLRNEKAMFSEQAKALGQGLHWKKAVGEKKKIWKKYLTAEKRTTADCFYQQVPPYYNPIVLAKAEVKQVEPGHLIVMYGEPVPPGTCGTGRFRWHLRLVEGSWLIERHEGIDDPAKPWKLDLP